MIKRTLIQNALLSVCLCAPLAACQTYDDTGTATVRQNKGDIETCMGELVTRVPMAKGSMELAFEITPDGKVGRYGVASDSVNDPTFAECVRVRAHQWQFPAPPSGKTEQFRYKFNVGQR